MFLLGMPGGYRILMDCFEENKGAIQKFFDTRLWDLTSRLGAAGIRAKIDSIEDKLPPNYSGITIGQVLNLDNWSEQMKALRDMFLASPEKNFIVEDLAGVFQKRINEIFTEDQAQYFSQKFEDKKTSGVNLNPPEQIDLASKLTNPIMIDPEKIEKLPAAAKAAASLAGINLDEGILISQLLNSGFYEALLEFITGLQGCIIRKLETSAGVGVARGSVTVDEEVARGSVTMGSVKDQINFAFPGLGESSGSSESSESRREREARERVAGGPSSPKRKVKTQKGPRGRGSSSRGRSGSGSGRSSGSGSGSGSGGGSGRKKPVKTKKAQPPRGRRGSGSLRRSGSGSGRSSGSSSGSGAIASRTRSRAKSQTESITVEIVDSTADPVMYNISYTIRSPKHVSALQRPDFIMGEVQRRYSEFDTFRKSLPDIGLESLSKYGAGKPGPFNKVNLQERVKGLNTFMNDLLQKSSATGTDMNKISARMNLCDFIDDDDKFRLGFTGSLRQSRASSSGAGGTARRASKKYTLEEKKTLIMDREYEELTIPDLKQLIECFGYEEFPGISETAQSRDKTLLQSFWDNRGVAKVIKSDWAAIKQDYIDLLMYIDAIDRSEIDRASEIFGTCKPKSKTRTV